MCYNKSDVLAMTGRWPKRLNGSRATGTLSIVVPQVSYPQYSPTRCMDPHEQR